MEIKDYQDIVEMVSKAKGYGLSCVVVFKPNCREDEGPLDPDMIISSSADPKVIAALLGNNCPDETEDEDEDNET